MEDWNKELSDFVRAGCRCEECNEERARLDALAEGFGSASGPELPCFDSCALTPTEHLEALVEQRDSLRQCVEDLVAELEHEGGGPLSERVVKVEELLSNLPAIFGAKVTRSEVELRRKLLNLAASWYPPRHLSMEDCAKELREALEK